MLDEFDPDEDFEDDEIDPSCPICGGALYGGRFGGKARCKDCEYEIDVMWDTDTGYYF